jgi:hypothetical protein
MMLLLDLLLLDLLFCWICAGLNGCCGPAGPTPKLPFASMLRHLATHRQIRTRSPCCNSLRGP